MINQWQGCYDDSWQGDIVPEAFSHPAKFSRGLIHRIYKHAKEMGWFNLGDWVLDPFGGVALGGLDAMSMGLNWIGVELEEKFVKLGEQNISLWQRELAGWPNLGTARIVQGDSRRLKEVLNGRKNLQRNSLHNGRECCCTFDIPFNSGNRRHNNEIRLIISSPPYSEARIGGIESMRRSNDLNGDYGSSPGQLGSMKEGNFDLCISSPPYAELLKPETEDQTARKQQRIAKSKTMYDGRKLESPSPGKAGLGGGYGTNPDNLGSLPEGSFDAIVSSPPYAEGIGHGHAGKNADRESHPERYKAQEKYASAFESNGNLGTLKEGSFDLCVSSPPYEGSGAGNQGGQQRGGCKNLRKQNGDEYGNTTGQIGCTSGDTFWSASREIVQQCYELLKDGGYAIWVTKNYIKNKKIVPFSDRWLALCESVGFKLICRHQAMLVKDHNQIHWINERIKNLKERKSFFRRNAEDKATAERFWKKINISIQNEYIEKAKQLVICKPTEKKIIQKAQILLWKDFLKPVEEIETRIDWEDVLCLVKNA